MACQVTPNVTMARTQDRKPRGGFQCQVILKFYLQKLNYIT